MVLGCFHSLRRRPMLPHECMRRLASILTALVLVLMLWTGTAVHAAERLECIATNSDAAGHYEGDRKEALGGTEQGTTQHHTSCSGNSLVAPSGMITRQSAETKRSDNLGSHTEGVPGSGPDSHLRPPIA